MRRCPSRSGPPGGARGRHAGHAPAARRPAGPPALHHHGEPLRRGIQPLRVARGHPLALGRDPRRHRTVLLREGPVDRAGLVHGAPAGVRAADWYNAFIATDRITFHRADGDIETRTEIAVVPEDSAEVRRVTLTNNSDETREIELTSYGEIVLAPPEADRSHPAFGNLFVETEWHDWCTRITATRRPRSSKEQPLWCVHVVDTGKHRVGPVTYETDRARFLGRGAPPAIRWRWRRTEHSPGRPARCSIRSLPSAPGSGWSRAVRIGGVHHPRRHQPRPRLRAGRPLPGFPRRPAGARSGVDLEPGGAARVPPHAERCGRVSGARRPSALRQRGAAGAAGRAAAEPGLAAAAVGNGVSGDWPILLATIDSADGLPTLRQILTAHRYWRRRGMMVDVVVLIARTQTYYQELADRVTSAVLCPERHRPPSTSRVACSSAAATC